MAVHFDFIVDDVDAENIFSSIRADALKHDESIMEFMCCKNISEEYRQSMITAFRANKEYTLALIKLMKNTRV